MKQARFAQDVKDQHVGTLICLTLLNLLLLFYINQLGLGLGPQDRSDL